MEYRQLGRTGITVSVLSLGTMTFGEQNTQSEGHAQLDRALAAGVNLIDTAELYPTPAREQTAGRTEEIVGHWLAARGGREKIVLATKIVGRTEQPWYRPDGAPARLTAAQIAQAVEGSLRRLKTDYIDLYQVHWPDRVVPAFGSNPTRYRPPRPAADETLIEETLEALGRHVEAGKIRHIGISNESPWGAMTWLRHAESGVGPRVASIQNAYSLINRTFEGGLAEIALREDLSLLAYSTLGQGFLTGKYRRGALPSGSRKQRFPAFVWRYEKSGAADAVERYCALAEEIGVSPAVLALKFAMTRPFLTSAILGASSVEQLEANLAAADFPLTDEMEGKIDAIHQLTGNPCP